MVLYENFCSYATAVGLKKFVFVFALMLCWQDFFGSCEVIFYENAIS